MGFKGTVSALPPEVQQVITDRFRGRQISVTSLPYYSKVRLAATFATIAGLFTYTIKRQTVQAFTYGVGQDMGLAGRGGEKATLGDTCIAQPGQTLNNSDVVIDGMSIEVVGGSEPKLLEQIFAETGLQISTDNRTWMQAGKCGNYPQAGGLHGGASSSLAVPEIPGYGFNDGGAGVPVLFASNGMPLAGSYKRFDAGPLIWSGQSANSSDNTLGVQFVLGRDIVVKSVAADRAGDGATIGPWTHPLDGERGTFVDLDVVLHAYQIMPISGN